MSVRTLGDADELTRSAYAKTVENDVIMEIPLLQRLWKGNRFVFDGGSSWKINKKTQDGSGLGQEYGPNDPMHGGSVDLIKPVEFFLKTFQVPIEYPASVELLNKRAHKNKLGDVVKEKTEDAQRESMLMLQDTLFGAASATSDDDIGVQGLADALTHDNPYGKLTRATTVTNAWWQGASIDKTFTDQGTEQTASIATVRKMRNSLAYYKGNKPADMLCVVSLPVFTAIQSEMETRRIYKPEQSNLFKYGFTAMQLDGIEIVAEPWFDARENAASATMTKYAFLLNIPSWKFMVSPTRALKMTQFVWQGEIVDGYDKYLARILFAGNLFTRRPNANIFLTNVVA